MNIDLWSAAIYARLPNKFNFTMAYSLYKFEIRLGNNTETRGLVGKC